MRSLFDSVHVDFGLGRMVICERAREVLSKMTYLEATSRIQRDGVGGSVTEAGSGCMRGEQIQGKVYDTCP